MDLVVGKSFSNYSELSTWIKEYEDAHFIQFFKSTSRTIEGARKKGTKRYINPDLVYTEITYSCIHSGKRTSRSTGQRPNQGSYRQNCKAQIRVKASSDGNSLEVNQCIESHNHEINKNTYACLPRQRAMDEPTRKMAEKMLELKVHDNPVAEEIDGLLESDEQLETPPVVSRESITTNSAPAARKRRIRKLTKEKQAISKLQKVPEKRPCIAPSKTLDEFDSFGSHIAAQMRQLPMQSVVLLQEKIQSLITHERLEHLSSQSSYMDTIAMLSGGRLANGTENNSSVNFLRD